MSSWNIKRTTFMICVIIIFLLIMNVQRLLYVPLSIANKQTNQKTAVESSQQSLLPSNKSYFIITSDQINPKQCGQLYLQKLYKSLYQRNDIGILNYSTSKFINYRFENEVFIAGVGQLFGGDGNQLVNKRKTCLLQNQRYGDINWNFIKFFQSLKSTNITSSSSIIILYDISFPTITYTLFDKKVFMNMSKMYNDFDPNHGNSIKHLDKWYKYNITFQGCARTYVQAALFATDHPFYDKLVPNLRQILFQYFCHESYVDKYGIAYSLIKDKTYKQKRIKYPFDNKSGTKNCSMKKYRFNYIDLMWKSHFCFVISGHTPFSFRLMESLSAGCIPIVIASGWILPFNQLIDWKRYCVFIEEEYFGKQFIFDINQFLDTFLYAPTSVVQNLLTQYYDNNIYNWHKSILLLYDKYFHTEDKRIEALIQIINWQRYHIHNNLTPNEAW
eukprot:511432_1